MDLLTLINAGLGAFIGVIGLYRLFRNDIEKINIELTKIQTELEWLKKEFEEKKKLYQTIIQGGKK